MSPTDDAADDANAAPADDALGVLRSTLTRMWPGSRTELVRSRRADPTALAELLLLPDSRAPRLLLPAGPAAAAASVRRFSAAATPVEVAARSVAALALRAGAGRALSERLRVHTDGGPGSSPGSDAAVRPLTDVLAAALGTASVSFSLSVGPPRVNRKPVLQLFDERGRSRGFAKLGDSPTARRHVREEASALRTLAGASFIRLRVPRALHHDAWGDVEVLVQEDLGVSPAAAWRRRTALPALTGAAMRELADAFAQAPAPLGRLPWWEQCLERAGAAPDAAAVGRLRAAATTVSHRHPEPLAVGAWHGDWTPWNMAPGRGADGRPVLLVWDWERFETGVPAGLDRVHHAVNAATRRDGTTREVVLGALPDRGPVAAAYLVAITARYLEMSAAPDGALVTSRALVTLEALEELLSSR